jgi:uncharacterized membrane protein
MKLIMRQDDIELVESRIKTFEDQTGCELLVVVARESDQYPAAVWRFSFISTFISIFIFSLFYEFHYAFIWPLAFGGLSLIMLYVGRLKWPKQLSLSDIETDRETEEKALEVFHTLGTSKVSHKVTAMIMVSLLERKIFVLVDEKLKEQITQEEIESLISLMKMSFKQGNMTQGLLESITSLEKKVLQDFNGRITEFTANELSNKIHFI